MNKYIHPKDKYILDFQEIRKSNENELIIHESSIFNLTYNIAHMIFIEKKERVIVSAEKEFMSKLVKIVENFK